MIPRTSWFNNLRKILSLGDWNKIRHTSYRDANFYCSICGDTGINQGYGHPLECHETWVYSDIIGGAINKMHLQTLHSINALCPMCHLSKHMGFASVINKQKEAIAHYANINYLTPKEAKDDVALAFEEWEMRSKFNWKLDCAKIEEQYGIKVIYEK